MKKINFSTIMSIAAAALMAMTAISCDKNGNEGNEDGLKEGDPGNVAKEALVAYIPFESDAEAVKFGEGLTFSKKAGAATWAKGRRGNSYKGASTEAYAAIDLASSNIFKNMKEYTVACWIKSTPAGGAAPILLLDGGDGDQGGLNILLEGGSDADSLDVKSYLYNAATVWKGQDLRIKRAAFTTDRWFHLVASYDAATSTMALYSNGNVVATSVRYADGQAEDGTQPLLGELTMSVGQKLYVGAWKKQAENLEGLEGWMAYYPGQIDELRIYNRALTEDEVKELYNAEVNFID